MAKMDHLENDESENVIQYDDSYFHPSKSLLVTAFCNPLAIPPCNDEHFDFCVDDDNYPEENIEVFFFFYWNHKIETSIEFDLNNIK